MTHDTPLIAVIVIGFALAFGFGTLANRLKLSPLVGYLLAGVLVGPFSPAFNADLGLTMQLAEIGVILLMFGVGLHFSPGKLLSIRAIVIPGALIQVTLITLLGVGVAILMGWRISAGIVLGISLSVASTVVVMRAMTERRILDTERGEIAIGWLIMQDLISILSLVLIPPMAQVLDGNGADFSAIMYSLWATLGKLVAFIILMFFAARRIMPHILHYIAHSGSRELFRLAVLSLALGIAFIAAELFGVSIALGAFFAGMILSDSPLSQRAAEETLPFRDAFAVLFFISVGMVFNPMIVIHQPLGLLLVLLVILISGAVAAGAARLLGKPWPVALVIGAALSQIGEFSFIIADLGTSLDILPASGRDLILGASIITICLNPLLFSAISRFIRRKYPEPTEPEKETVVQTLEPTTLSGHTVIVGYGRVGRLVAEGLKAADMPLLVIENAPDAVEKLQACHHACLVGNAATKPVLEAANLPGARMLIVAIPEIYEASEIVRQARDLVPTLQIVARAHFDAQEADLKGQGATAVIVGEQELARAMLHYAGAGS